jgi:hypothetical protein
LNCAQEPRQLPSHNEEKHSFVLYPLKISPIHARAASLWQDSFQLCCAVMKTILIALALVAVAVANEVASLHTEQKAFCPNGCSGAYPSSSF